jgi:hypothetical protein
MGTAIEGGCGLAAHFDLNVIVVGADKFTPVQRQQVNDSILVMTSIYSPLGPTVGTVNRFSISTANSRFLHNIFDDADAEKLADLFSVKTNEAIDLFVVANWAKPNNGLSPMPGKCPKLIRKGLRSPVVSLNTNVAFSGNTFAHETGHFLGLPHAEDDSSLVAPALVASNFMATASGSNTSMTQAQSDKMGTHCTIRF